MAKLSAMQLKEHPEKNEYRYWTKLIAVLRETVEATE